MRKLVLFLALSFITVNGFSNEKDVTVQLLENSTEAGMCFVTYTVTGTNPQTGESYSNTYTDYLGMAEDTFQCNLMANAYIRTLLQILNNP